METARPDWAPAHIDVDTPSAARVYDYYLGGCHNFAADRAMAEKAFAVLPHGPMAAQLNRGFLRRAVRYCVDAGIRQFLDLGSGIPTLGNVHEIAQQAAPDARVVYVDLDPTAVAHSRAMLAGNDNTGVVQADLRDPDRILADPEVRRLLDLDRPVALLLLAVLHFVPDSDDPAGLLDRLRSALAPGSYLAISHATAEQQPPVAQQIADAYRNTPSPLTLRGRAAVHAFFDGFDLLEPGVVWSPQWRPESPEDVVEQPELSSIYVGLARLN